MEAGSKIESMSVITKTTGSLDIQYEVSAEKISGDESFCNALKLEAEHNGIEKHNGQLLSLDLPTTSQLGTWELEIDLPISATNVPHGVECNVDLVFKGWRADTLNFEDSGFTDEETIQLRLTSRMIVLNEFLPNPEGIMYGFDFGNDNSTMPQGEWVELYNNSDTSLDLYGWYIWDNSSDDLNKAYVTVLNTLPSTTVIGAHSWLVVYMNKEILDNSEDTVKLFDGSDNLIDSYAYDSSIYCEQEPTPGEENSSGTSGSCGEVPPNKSYARIPDGLGYWVDPIPTPGRMNKLDEERDLERESIAIYTEVSELDGNIEVLDNEVEDSGLGTPLLNENEDIFITEDIASTTSTEEIIVTIEEVLDINESTTTEETGEISEIATTSEEVSNIENGESDLSSTTDPVIDFKVEENSEEIISQEGNDEEIEQPELEDPITNQVFVEEILVFEEQPAIVSDDSFLNQSETEESTDSSKKEEETPIIPKEEEENISEQ